MEIPSEKELSEIEHRREKEMEERGKSRLSIGWFWGFLFLLLLFVLGNIASETMKSLLKSFIKHPAWWEWLIYTIVLSAIFLVILKTIDIPLGSVI